MPTPICATPKCDQLAHDGRICWTCTNALTTDLEFTYFLAEQLVITITKQDRIGDRSGPRATEIPLPYRPAAAETGWLIHSTLVGWIRHLAPNRDYPPNDALGTLGGWLHTRIDRIRQDELAGLIVDEIGHAIDRGRRAIDKPPLLAYLGPCTCGPDTKGRPIELYARPNAVQVDCKACGTTYEVAKRRAWLLERAEDQLLTATECSRALPGLLGDKLTAAMIRGFAHRGRLEPRPPHPHDHRQDPRYRVGDVLDLLARIRQDDTPKQPQVCA